MAGVVIFLDFYGFISKSGKVYSISVGIQSYGGLAENITLLKMFTSAIIMSTYILKMQRIKVDYVV